MVLLTGSVNLVQISVRPEREYWPEPGCYNLAELDQHPQSWPDSEPDLKYK